MSTITVNLRDLSGTVELEVPEGATVADVRAAGNIDAGMNLRSEGQSLSDDQPVSDEQTFVATPPAAKHGGR